MAVKLYRVQTGLVKTYEGTVREVGTDDVSEQQVVVLDLGTVNGRLILRGLTMEEAREVGAFLYRPVQVRIEVQGDTDVVMPTRGA